MDMNLILIMTIWMNKMIIMYLGVGVNHKCRLCNETKIAVGKTKYNKLNINK